jgi:NurA domain
MLSRARAAEALEAEREGLLRAAHDSTQAAERYRRALDEMLTLSGSELDDRLGGVPWPGARPTSDFDKNGGLVRFPHRWKSAEESRVWALEKLRGVPTAAVDGSQIAASREFGVPVSLVQVGWFLNPHDGQKSYVKDVRNIILPPEGSSAGEEFASVDSMVNRCRFIAEMDAACAQVKALRGLDPPAVVFFDGTFVLSFAGRIPPPARAGYLQALFRLLDASRESRVPVMGYVDLSLATDLTTMLRTAFEVPEGNVYDAQILGPRLDPFDRCAAFVSARRDILPQYETEDRDYGADLAFVYMQTGRGRAPARLDLPVWVVEDGLLEHVLDVVRAEIVVGSGYPYALETADVTALLTTEDRLAFFRMFGDFASEAGLQVMMPAKSASKGRRR